jgi:hypothetical protein
VWLRCVTLWRAPDLDDELASGADPWRTDALSLRTGQLRSAKARARFARALEGALQIADREVLPASALPPLVRRREVRSCRAQVRALAERLRAGGELGVQGLAMISQLVRDGDSPLYDPHARVPLSVALRSALVALDDHSGAKVLPLTRELADD